ncbi:MAG: DUF4347 domain-containing protein [Nitrospira sp.]|nr:DUF4347 domain-containing protein [Nitrospira sp.]
MSLEQRLMFDAAASVTASEVASEQVAQEQAEAAVSNDGGDDGLTAEQADSQGLLDAIATYNPGASRSEVVFVDPTVPNYQDLLSGMNPNIEVIMLDGGQDGIEQMANALSGRSGIDAIHVISHGGAGELQLGTGVLNADSMSTQYADDLAVIQQSLSEQADILVYGCDFAQGEAGQAAVDMLADLTGADVQASSDLTGSISLGGDWEFEVSTGTIETSLAIGYGAQMNWAGVLGTETVTDSFSSKSFGNNDGTQSWSSQWSEVDVGASDARGGHIKVNSGELRIETQVVGASVSRGVDLSSARSATLSFDYNNDLDKQGTVEVRISTDGGANYRTLSDGVFSKTSHTGNGMARFDISDHLSANTKIQFLVTGTSGGDRLFVDNVQVSYETGVVNHAPTDLALSANTVAENAATGTVVGTVSGTDPDAGDTKTYSLTDTAGGRFAINSATGQLTVADGSLLNYESAASHTVTVRVTDSGGQSYDETFTINLSNVNEGPTDLSLSANTVAENAATGTVVGTVSGTDPDAGDTKTYSLTDTAGGRFAINASTGQLTVADGSLLNYESAASHTVTVRVTDSGGQSYDETFTINLSNVNEGPTGADATITLSEDTSHTLSLANFGFSDVDAGDSLSAVRIDTLPTAGTLTLSGGAVTAGQVVSAADITAGRLVFSPAAEANGTGYASLTFSVQDSHNTYDTAPNTLTFTVTAVNDTPTDLSLSANTVAEQAATGTVVGTVRGTDPDAGDTKTYSLTDTAGGRFAINASTGQLTVADGSLLNYEAATSHTVTVRVTDSGGQSYDETFTLNLSNVNEGQSAQVASSNQDGSLIGSLFRNGQGPPSSTGKSIDSVGEPGMGDIASVSIPPNDSHHTIELGTQETPARLSIPTARNVAQSSQEEVAIHGKGKSQTSPTAGGKGMAESLDSEKSLSDPGRGTGPWTWSQADEVETGQGGSALGMSMAVGLAGMVWQGNKGNKEKVTTMKSQAHQQQPLPDRTSQPPNAEDDTPSSNESQR